MPWLKPSLALRWGSYSKLDGDEQGQIVDATIKAKEGGLLTLRMALEKIAPIFGIENVDAVITALEKETADKEAAAIKKQKTMQDAGVVPPPTAAPGDKKAPPPQPQPET